MNAVVVSHCLSQSFPIKKPSGAVGEQQTWPLTLDLGSGSVPFCPMERRSKGTTYGCGETRTFVPKLGGQPCYKLFFLGKVLGL